MENTSQNGYQSQIRGRKFVLQKIKKKKKENKNINKYKGEKFNLQFAIFTKTHMNTHEGVMCYYTTDPIGFPK